MKQQTAIIIAAIISIAIVSMVLIMRKDLCEVRFRTGQTELAAYLAYESK